MPIVVQGATFFDTFKSSKAIESPIYQGRQYETVVVLLRSIGMKIAELGFVLIFLTLVVCSNQ